MERTVQIIYVYRTAGGGGGTLTGLGLATCSGNISPFIPPRSQLLMRMARLHQRKNAGPDGEGTVVHAELAADPGDRQPLSIETLDRELRHMGIRRTGNKQAMLYDCMPNDVLKAIAAVRDGTHAEPRKGRRTAARNHANGHPAADALDWDEATRTIESLRRDGRWRDALLVASGCFLGLRISDLLTIRWKDITDTDTFTVREKKTGKERKMRINPALKALAREARKETGSDDGEEAVFRSWARDDGGSISRQRAGQILREIKDRYSIRSARVFSTHSLRKTFGRRIWQQECRKGRGEQALLLLCDVFGHSSVNITKRYLGIRQEEILSVYDSLTD